MPRKYKDLTGQVFGYLTVVKETKERIRGAKIWLCKCKCGKEKKVKTDYLQQKWTRSCGCLKKEKAKEKLPFAIKNNPKLNQDISISKFNTLLRSYSYGAKKRNYNFCLTKQEVLNFVTQPCHYCGYLPDIEKNDNSAIYGDFFNGIDRKNSNKGYSVENCVPCCSTCNTAKNKMGYTDFNNYIDRLIEWRKKNVSVE